METQTPPSLPSAAALASPPQGQAKHHGLQEQFSQKNRLQEYAQRSALGLPSYHTVNAEGSKFNSTVFIDGNAYTSSQTFARRKDAEQDAAKVAYETIFTKIKENGCPPIHEDTTFCKSILNEYAVKMKLPKATYTTTEYNGLVPVFISVSVFDGMSYRGGPGRNKKEAEQLAARAAVQSILGKPDMLLSEIIKSKTNLYAAMKEVKDNDPKTPTPVQRLKKPKLEPVYETSNGFINNMMLVVGQSSCSSQMGLVVGAPSTIASTSGKKNPRKKNKKVLKKKLVDGRLFDLIMVD